jgi:ATP:ADP antiporter, AAA family
MKSTPSPLFDVREGEGRVVLRGLALVLLVIITGHTVLEAARDALLLAGPGPRALGAVYMAIAVCAWPSAALAAKASERFGARRSLGGALAIAAGLPLLLFALRPSALSAMAVYVVSGLVGSVVVPQFWTLAGKILTAAQGRRLFGLIAAAGVVGGVLGSALATTVLLVLPVRALLLVAAAGFVGAGAALMRLSGDERIERPPAGRAPLAAPLRHEPLLARVALSVVVSTSALLVLDYCFKASVARSFPPERIGPFVARYYLALNGLSLVVQLFVASAVVRRLGLTAALVLTPLLLVVAAAAAAATGGALAAVMVLKAIDGGLRFSIHRITGELIYLPVPVRLRQRVKPLIDGALGRASQTLTGAALLALQGTRILAPQPLAALVCGLAGVWLAVAVALRRPYLALLRAAIATGSLAAPEGPEPLDLESAQLLVRRLASEDALEVLGAMNALGRRGSDGFVPALILLHPDQAVLCRALAYFGASARTDWVPQAQRLLGDARESVRMAAARALSMHHALDLERIARDVGWRVRGYAAIDLALRDDVPDALEDERVNGLLQRTGPQGEEARVGMLAAMADADRSPSLPRLLMAIGAGPDVGASTENAELFARAAARQRDPRLIPLLIERLSVREGREAVRESLVAFGDDALAALWWTLRDTTRPRGLRTHVPKTLARFGSRAAAEYLLESIETEEDGQVKYKSIRALELLVHQRRIALDRVRVERLALQALTRHARLLGLRAAVAGSAGDEGPPAAESLLRGLLDDKLAQSLERAYRLLAIAHPREDFQRMRWAAHAKDSYTRANVAELLDALLRHRDQQTLRTLLRSVGDDLPLEQRAQRAAALVGGGAPAGRAEALSILERDHDPVVARLASACAHGAAAPATPRGEAPHG